MKELRTMMGWYYGGMGWGGWVAMALAMVAFWGLVVLAVVAIFRGTRDTWPMNRASHRDAMEILDERYARGEIDHEEYQARKAVLSGTRR
jgi:putative membrane protein